jgi:hypothetical protein
MESVQVRMRLTGAVGIDLIGPGAEDVRCSEILDRAPTRWYLSGFLAPWNAPAVQKEDGEGQEERHTADLANRFPGIAVPVIRKHMTSNAAGPQQHADSRSRTPDHPTRNPGITAAHPPHHRSAPRHAPAEHR